MQISRIYGIMTIFPKIKQYFSACARFYVITTSFKQYFPNLMISRVNVSECFKGLLSYRASHSKTPSHFIHVYKENTAAI